MSTIIYSTETPSPVSTIKSVHWCRVWCSSGVGSGGVMVMVVWGADCTGSGGGGMVVFWLRSGMR